MAIKKHIIKQIKKTGSEHRVCENNPNQILEPFISMKFDAECNATTPGMSVNQFYNDLTISRFLPK